MSFSWVDPHFAALYARREEERLVALLAAQAGNLQEQFPTAQKPLEGRAAPLVAQGHEQSSHPR